MLDLMKKVLKGTMATLSIVVATLVLVKVAVGIFDIRIIVAALGGAFGYKPLCDLFSKIKGLE